MSSLQRISPICQTYTNDVTVPNAVDADIGLYRDMVLADGIILRLPEFLPQGARRLPRGPAKLNLLHNVMNIPIGLDHGSIEILSFRMAYSLVYQRLSRRSSNSSHRATTLTPATRRA